MADKAEMIMNWQQECCKHADFCRLQVKYRSHKKVVFFKFLQIVNRKCLW